MINFKQRQVVLFYKLSLRIPVRYPRNKVAPLFPSFGKQCSDQILLNIHFLKLENTLRDLPNVFIIYFLWNAKCSNTKSIYNIFYDIF